MNKDKSFIKGDAAYINYIKAFILEAAVTAVFIAIFSGVCCFASGGLKYAAVFATVSAAAGAFAAAWFLARKMGSKGWLIGLAVGFASFALITLASLIINRGSVTGTTLFHLVIIILSAMIGGVLGVNKNTGKNYL